MIGLELPRVRTGNQVKVPGNWRLDSLKEDNMVVIGLSLQELDLIRNQEKFSHINYLKIFQLRRGLAKKLMKVVYDGVLVGAIKIMVINKKTNLNHNNLLMLDQIQLQHRKIKIRMIHIILQLVYLIILSPLFFVVMVYKIIYNNIISI